ncbi:ABC transporter substrate-binding protein [Planctomycetota bacterium]|nr:ABC transporter substrate-binding protein [Planctomycetota bacterium]
MSTFSSLCRPALRCLAGIAAVAGLAAGDSKPLTIWWAQWAPADGLQQLSEDFTKSTGIAVKVHQIPWSSYQDQVFLAFGNKTTEFDIVVGDSQWIGRGATKGLYLNLTSWLPGAVDLKAQNPQVLRYLCEYPGGSGNYWAAPCESDAVGFSYRADWFADPAEKSAFKAKFNRDLAPPATWAEFKDVAVFFHRPEQKRFGCALLTGRGYDSLVMGFQQLLWAWGGSWGDPATFKVTGKLDSPQAAAALGFFKELMAFGPAGATNLDYGKSLEAFTNGSTAMAMNYFAFAPGIAKQMGDKAGFFVMPTQDGRRTISLGGQGLSISAKVPVERQEQAKKFIAWFLTEPVQRQWITKDAGFTANTAILKSEAFRKAAPYNAAFADSLDSLQDFWNVPVYNELLAAAQKRLGEALDGVKTPAAALTELAKEHQDILTDAGLAK